jgi:hypothetical protein
VKQFVQKLTSVKIILDKTDGSHRDMTISIKAKISALFDKISV